MTELSQRIYCILNATRGTWLPMRRLEAALDVEERSLQSISGNIGPLDMAIEEIFRDYGLVIVTRAGAGGGVQMTDDAALVMQCRDTLSAQIWHTKARVDRWTKMLNMMQSSQVSIFSSPTPSER